MIEQFFKKPAAIEQHRSAPVVGRYLDGVVGDLAKVGYTRSTVRRYVYACEEFGRFLDHLERDRGNSVATRNARLAALHVFYRHVASRDPQSFALCQRALGVPAKRAPRREVHYLERDEMDALIGAIDRSQAAGRRDHALVTFAWQTGARVGEVTALRACDLQLEAPAHVRIWGKGRKERVVPLWPSTAAVLRAWLAERNIDPRSPGPVFVNLRGGVLTRWGVRHILKKHARIATAACPTVAEKRIHPHVIHHTTAVHMLQAGADASAIRDVLGHQSAETTWRYTRINLEMKRKAVESCMPVGASLESPVPIWRRDQGILAELEALGRRRGYVESRGPADQQSQPPPRPNSP